MAQTIIQMHDVSKKVDNNRVVLQDINLTIEKGDAVALIGHNGTGKSTMLRLISGLTPISSGKILTVPHLNFGFIPEHFPKINMTVEEYIYSVGRINGIAPSELKMKVKELYGLFYIEDMIEVPIKHLSKGSIQKVAVIQALLCKPDVLLMDEPLAGQDIKSQKNFMKLVKEMNDEGVTLIMSCHELFLVNQLAKTAYEIKNRTLSPIQMKRKVAADQNLDILFFDKGSGLSNVSPEILKWVYNSIENDDIIQIVVNKEKSNDVLKLMLKDGFVLRAMKGV